MAINSVIGAYYYFRVIVVMYMHEYKGPLPADAPTGLSATALMVVAVTVIATIYLGLWPNQILALLTSQNPMLTAR
jgi:NADH-quinone oxidoreductase subunit N